MSRNRRRNAREASPFVWRRVYALLLYLYPEPVRRDARSEMLQLFADLYADVRVRRGRIRAAGFALRACGEVIPRAIDARRGASIASGPAAPALSMLPRAHSKHGRWNAVFDGMFNELRYALRTFRLNPGYTAVIVLTLAVGIGANTAIFSVVKGVLLDTLPYENPERVVGIWQYGLASGQRARMTSGNFVDVRAMSDVFDSAAAFGYSSATLIHDDGPELVQGGRVTADYLDVLGVRPILGRAFRADDEIVGGPAVTIIGEELWTRRFAADPAIVGKTLNFDGTPFEVIGVLPRGVYPTFATVNGETPFTPDNHDFLVPLRLSENFYGDRRAHVFGAIGKLAEGVTIERANAAVDVLAASVREQYPIVAGEGFRLESLADEIVGGARTGLLVLMGTVAMVLLIAATNVASLMLARADERRSELAVRAALGAGRWVLVRQSLVESLALAGSGAAAGVALAYLSIDRIKALVPIQIPRMNEVVIDTPTLLFAVGIALLVGTVLGVAPAAMATRPGRLGRLRQGARGLTADGKRRRAQGLLVAAQACMAVMLVIGAGLLMRTFMQIASIDPGFSTRSTLTVPLSLPQTRYPTNNDALSFIEQLEESLTALPGVESVAFGYDHPLRKNWGDAFRLEGRPNLAPGEGMGASFRPVTPGYFEAVGISLLRGRTFESTDDAEHSPAVVINEAFAEKYFSGEGAVGQRIRIPTVGRMLGVEGVRWMEIVGVVGNVRFNGPTQAVEPAMYVSILQVPIPPNIMLVEPANADVDLIAAVRSAVWQLDAELPVSDVRSLDVLFAEAIARERFNMILVGFFAALALGLAGLGIYGLVSRLVHMQTKEIGIRVALGAQRGQVLSLVLGTALVPVMIGGLLGIVGAAGVARLLESLLYGVAALDPATFLLTPLVLVATALLASYLPARRATLIDPVTALRDE